MPQILLKTIIGGSESGHFTLVSSEKQICLKSLSKISDPTLNFQTNPTMSMAKTILMSSMMILLVNNIVLS